MSWTSNGPSSPRSGMPTTLGVSVVVVLVTLAASEGCRRLLGAGSSSVTVWIAGAIVSTLLVFAVNRAAAARLVWDGVFAVSDGLLSLTEGDYGVRLAVGRDDQLGRLIRRFNALAETLSSGGGLEERTCLSAGQVASDERSGPVRAPC